MVFLILLPILDIYRILMNSQEVFHIRDGILSPKTEDILLANTS